MRTSLISMSSAFLSSSVPGPVSLGGAGGVVRDSPTATYGQRLSEEKRERSIGARLEPEDQGRPRGPPWS